MNNSITIALTKGRSLRQELDLAHQIIDIVETGNTLKANGLVTIDHVADVSARLIVSKTSMKMKHQHIQNLWISWMKLLDSYD